jgi:hypothetical protein
MCNDFARTTKAATVTLKLSRSCSLSSRNWMRSRFQAFEVRAIPTSRCNNNGHPTPLAVHCYARRTGVDGCPGYAPAASLRPVWVFGTHRTTLCLIESYRQGASRGAFGSPGFSSTSRRLSLSRSSRALILCEQVGGLTAWRPSSRPQAPLSGGRARRQDRRQREGDAGVRS